MERYMNQLPDRSTHFLRPLVVLAMAIAACLGSGLARGEPVSGDAAMCPHHSNEDGAPCMHHAHDGKAGWESMRSRLDELQLTSTQQQEMAQLFAIYQPRFAEIARRGQADREALLETAPGAEAYNDLVARVSQEASSAAGEVVVLLAELQANAYALLDDEQQARYRVLLEEAAARRAELKAKMAAKQAEKEAARKESGGGMPFGPR